jgi:hypothetical protein
VAPAFLAAGFCAGCALALLAVDFFGLAFFAVPFFALGTRP